MKMHVIFQPLFPFSLSVGGRRRDLKFYATELSMINEKKGEDLDGLFGRRSRRESIGIVCR